MKAKSILAASFILISSFAFANDDNKFAVIPGQETGIFKVIFEDQAIVNTTITVFDKAGKLVYTKAIKSKNGFILPMNFTGLRSGDYTIELKNGSTTWMQTINYSNAITK